MKKLKQSNKEQDNAANTKLNSKDKRLTLKQENHQLDLLTKKGLAVIETLYLTNPEIFRLATIEAYSHIVSELNSMGGMYKGQEQLLEQATNQLLMQAKKPMQKAGQHKETVKETTKKAM